MGNKVVILGGGVAGLSAAHELIERGFEVHVYEMRSIPGGKARSISVPGTGIDGRKDLPGEHGFRFFPRFYKHVINTMQRTPIGDGRTALDNLVQTTRVEMARYDAAAVIAPSWFPRTLHGIRLATEDMSILVDEQLGIPIEELLYFGERLWQIVSSCGERRALEYEKIAWWDFINAEEFSEPYQKFLGHGITRSLVAAKARLASTKTIGDIFIQLLFDIVQPGTSSDRVLNGPTNEAWIDPWLEFLISRGVQYHLDHKVVHIECVDGVIESATVEHDGQTHKVTADYYISAVPVEKMMLLLTPELLAAEPSLAGIRELGTKGVSWMNGLQLYLTEDVKLTHGHTIYIDSQWALTSISQKQFWPGIDLADYGDGTVKGILSVDISEWDQPGLNGLTAKEATREGVMRDAWQQIKKSQNVGGTKVLTDDMLHHFFLDPDIYRNAEGDIENSEPLLVNLVDSWHCRPTAITKIPNFFLASDYVRTYTDLATMEGANEAARRAVNGILRAAESSAPPCGLWPLAEPAMFKPLRELDRIRYEAGLPWDPTLSNLATEGFHISEMATKVFADTLGASVRSANMPVYGTSPGLRDNYGPPEAELTRETAIFDHLIQTVFGQLQQAQVKKQTSQQPLTIRPGKPK